MWKVIRHVKRGRRSHAFHTSLKQKVQMDRSVRACNQEPGATRALWESSDRASANEIAAYERSADELARSSFQRAISIDVVNQNSVSGIVAWGPAPVHDQLWPENIPRGGARLPVMRTDKHTSESSPLFFQLSERSSRFQSTECHRPSK